MYLIDDSNEEEPKGWKHAAYEPDLTCWWVIDKDDEANNTNHKFPMEDVTPDCWRKDKASWAKQVQLDPKFHEASGVEENSSESTSRQCSYARNSV